MARREGADPGRIAAYRRGLFGETLAAWLLQTKFYRILERRYRTPAGEIDLIARRWNTIVFVEVKHHATQVEALDAIGTSSRKRITRAANLWLAAHPDAAGFNLRFDLVIVLPGRLPCHIISIFDAEGRS